MFYFTKKFKLAYFAAIIFLIVIASQNSNAQFADLFDHPEFFGLKKSLNTNRVTKSLYDDKNYIYVSIWGNGVYNSTDDGATWNPLNNGLTNFYITDMAISKSGNLLVTTMGDGIYHSLNKGQSWLKINTGLNHLNVKTIAVFTNGWLLAGTYGGGVYISKDEGSNWVQIVNGLRYRDINAIAFTQAGYFVAATNGGGMYASRDSGKTWIVQNTGLKNYYINDLVLNNSGSLFAATNGRGVVQSANDGLSWAELDTFMIRPFTLNHSPLPDLNATTITMNRNDKVVFGSRFGGAFIYDDVEDFAWIPSDIRGKGINALMTAKSGDLWAYPANNVPMFSNGIGDVWVEKTEIDTAKSPKSPKILIIAKNKLLLYDNKGNFYLSTDDGDSWQLASSIGKQQIYNVAKDSTGNLLAATSNGLYVSDLTASTWTRIRFKDTTVFDVQVAPGGRIWVVTQLIQQNPPPSPPSIYKNIFVSIDGITWLDKSMDLSAYSESPQKIAITNNNLVYVAVANLLFYTSDNGNSWKSTNTLGKDNQVLDIAIGKNNIVYAASYQGLYKTTSPGVLTSIPTLFPYSSLVYLDNNDVIYSSGMYNYSDNFTTTNITYRSTDGGANWKVLNNCFNNEAIACIRSNSEGDVYMTTNSGLLYKSVNPTTLAAPKLGNIPDKSEDVISNPIFNWETVDKAELYQIQLSIDQDFIYDFESVTLSDNTYQIQSKFFPNKKFWWRVRAKNHAAYSPWSELRTFVTKLATPTLVAPDSNALGVSVYAGLIWNKVEGASGYDIIVSKSKNFADTVMYIENFSDTTKITNLLDGLTTYFWKVRAKNDKSTSYWSNLWNFKTVVGPPRLNIPSDKEFGLMTAINFNWHKAIQATSYFIQISTKPDFSDTLKESSVSDTLFQYSDLNYDKVYYWRVRSVNNEGASEYSDIWSFRTGYSPVSLNLPENSKVNLKIPVALKWMKHETQNIYELQLAGDELFTKDLQKFENLDNLLEYIPSDMKYFTDYYWRVRVTSSENTGIWSEVRTFRTILGKSGLRMPTDKSTGLPTSLSFLWYSLHGADKYHLQISNDINFQDLVFSQDTITNYSIPIKDLKENSTFYWKVRGLNADGYGEWSEVWTFSTSGSAPVLVSPVNGAEEIKIPTLFKWEFFTNSISYKLQVAKDQNFDNVVAGGNAIENTEFSLNIIVLEPSTTYYWHVQANLSDGSFSPWSQLWSFTTSSILSVEDGQINENSSSYPNPFKDYTTITFNVNTPANASIKIIDMSGKIVITSELGILPEGENKYIWNPKGLSKGVYYYTIKLDKETIQGSLVHE